MNVIFIASAVAVGTLLLGIVIAATMGWFGRLVTREQTAMNRERERYNLAATMGLEIPIEADTEEQMKAARLLAAKRAASLPRGANMKVGNMGEGNQPTAFDGVKDDPISAVKIASISGWEGLRVGMSGSTSAPTAAVRAPAQTAPAEKSAKDLVPGEDYPFIEITDDMDPAEKRKARIANAKARSAAVKAIKEAGGVEAVPATVEAPSAAQAAPTSVPEAASIKPAGEPVAGVDYEVIEITDDMEPAEVRAARIANAKAKSAAMKAYKESAGAGQSAAAAAPPSPTSPAADQSDAEVSAAEVQAEAATVATADIPRPEYIEITDDMDPSDVRTARIQNAKMKSAYNKALKAAGIDPSTVSE